MSIRQQTPKNLIGSIRVDFLKDEIDQLVWDKGQIVNWEQSAMCPCRKPHTAPVPNCQNCLGTGWIMLNTVQTKMVISSLNTTNKYTPWSPERVGTIQITALNENRLSFMDRITVLSGEMVESEIVYLSELGDTEQRKVGFLSYRAISVLEIFVFQSYSQKLRKLVPEDDYTFDGYTVYINNTVENVNLNLISIRYLTNPEYYIIDIPHDIRNSEKMNYSNQPERINLPISAVGRRSHIVLERIKVGGGIQDNSY